jgi:hypothetical protein
MFTRVTACTASDSQKEPFLEELQTIRCLLIRFKRFRLERELAGPDFHRRNNTP